MTSSPLANQLRHHLAPLKPAQIRLIGSWASGDIHEDSDVELVGVLNESGISRNYAEKRIKRKKVREALRPLADHYAFDLLVYTRDEWDEIQNSDAAFSRELATTGIIL